MRILHIIAFLLTVIGALNWGLVGAADLNVVKLLLGAYPIVERGANILIGLSAAYLIFTHFTGDCRSCAHK